LIEKEIERLLSGEYEKSSLQGKLLTNILVRTSCNSKETLTKCKEVLLQVLNHTEDPWPTVEEWRTILPQWFVKKCAREISQEEAEKRILLKMKERIRITKEEGWTLSAWIYWFEPDERAWWWWDAIIQDEHSLIVTLETESWPFPWEALEWLLMLSGATCVEEQ